MLNFTIPRRVFQPYCYSAFRLARNSRRFVSLVMSQCLMTFLNFCSPLTVVLEIAFLHLSLWILTHHVIVCGHPLTCFFIIGCSCAQKDINAPCYCLRSPFDVFLHYWLLLRTSITSCSYLVLALIG
jgi:hypothetical protein